MRLKFGFQGVDMSIFRPETLSKGQELLHRFHVSDVYKEIPEKEEIIEKYPRRLVGPVLRETPGIASSKADQNVYLVNIEVIVCMHNLYMKIIDRKYVSLGSSH